MARGPHHGARVRRALARDEDGAVLVVGVFLAAMVSGFLYYLVGLGDAILYRERMQDAADAVAFAGAAMHARGMNLVALVNVTMALLVAVYFTLRLVQTSLFVASLVCTTWHPSCGWAFGGLVSGERTFGDASRSFRDRLLDPALTAGHEASDSVRVAWPYLAQTQVVTETLASARPTVTSGFLHPVIDHPLPLRPVPTGVAGGVCDRGGERVAAMLPWPLGGRVLAPLAGVLERFLGWFGGAALCGELGDQEGQRPFGIDPGDGSCEDGLPGQDCEYAQVRGIVRGEGPTGRGPGGVRAPGRGPGAVAGGALGRLTLLSVAQAEYYYEGPEPRDEWLLHPSWRARMRRFRMPSNALGISGLAGVDLGAVGRAFAH